ncbi:hypothetical protein HA402_006203 [Bradysia odoriphaga]|nr:hypothetical protein HA402_006203 [Bradysia odoriphaga]
MTVTLMDWGATWLSAVLPLKSGEQRELLLGCQTPQDYLHQGAYLGATVGRYANRIAHACLSIDGKPHPLIANQGEHQLHGGPNGFHARRWQIVQQNEQQVIYQLHSPDGDQGFPGNLDVTLTYRLTADHRLEIEYQAQTDRACPVNLTNHAYFNLDGAGHDARQQRLQLFADRYLPVDGDGIPSADLTAVAGTGMDFRQPKTLQQDLLRDRDQQRVKGYDHAYLLHATCHGLASPAAHLWSADGKVAMTVFTTAPALQLYSGLLLSTNLMAADTAAKTPSPAQAAQQKRMTDCNQQATTQSLKGSDRTTFMSTCLKAEGHQTEKALTPQQQKMKSCNADAAKKSLKGDERKTFMSSCLKKNRLIALTLWRG